MSRRPAAPYLSIVVPIHNEAASITPLLEQIHQVMERTGWSYETILVDDGSTDDSWGQILAHSRSCDHLVGLRLTRNYGQTAALMAGIDQSCGVIIVTMDGDLQNDPADIPKLVAKIEEGNEIVSGWRRKRRDSFIGRRLPSQIANVLIRKLTRLPIHDQGCALKAYRGALLRSVSLYSNFHRFVVPLVQIGGARVAEVETNHRAREHGRSKYGLSRTFRVLADLMTLTMITRFSDRLLLWFLLFAVFPFLLGSAAILWTAIRAVADPGTPVTVPIGSALILFQTVFAITAYGLLAERIRQLAPTTRRRGSRLLASVSSAGGGHTPVLIRGTRAIPLARRRQPREV